jgi:hypothetical protein
MRRDMITLLDLQLGSKRKILFKFISQYVTFEFMMKTRI